MLQCEVILLYVLSVLVGVSHSDWIKVERIIEVTKGKGISFTPPFPHIPYVDSPAVFPLSPT